ncbi:uncharacterized protein LOC126879090 [Diabrotica virgifera virgifera]|uniref:Kazal-like domain-containing protein n=1 Tax=Diabrotica virgifera virgifera TaxID=50390 RepID=A0ABM5JJ55_DIAVI|nr:uncharacterized protein LOC126879090 [Diabrotica virgifera virgifera]
MFKLIHITSVLCLFILFTTEVTTKKRNKVKTTTVVPECPYKCNNTYVPVCSTANVTYNNICLFKCDRYISGMLMDVWKFSACEDVSDSTNYGEWKKKHAKDALKHRPAEYTVAPKCPIKCNNTYAPVCATTNVTYGNICLFSCAVFTGKFGMTISKYKACENTSNSTNPDALMYLGAMICVTNRCFDNFTENFIDKVGHYLENAENAFSLESIRHFFELSKKKNSDALENEFGKDVLKIRPSSNWTFSDTLLTVVRVMCMILPCELLNMTITAMDDTSSFEEPDDGDYVFLEDDISALGNTDDEVYILDDSEDI